jgi:dTDP-glucose pyrophosphorylase
VPYRTLKSEMNLVITMGGLGSRFGGKTLKPFIQINNLPMFYWAEKSARNFFKSEYPQAKFQIYGCIKAEFTQNLNDLIFATDSKVIPLELPFQTKGPAESVYLCDLVSDEKLVIHDCDLVALPETIESSELDEESDITLYYTTSINPQHSYLEIESGQVSRIEEKSRISENGVVGIYVFRSKRLFDHLYVNTIFQNEFFISDVVKTALRLEYRIKAKKVSKCFSLGTPEELSQNIQFLDQKFFEALL